MSLYTENLEDGIENLYEISPNQREEIEKFLKKHDYLYPIIREAKEKINSVYGENIKTCIELHHDPEEGGWKELFIVIKSNHTPEEALRLENKLANEWFLDRMDDTKGRLNITGEPL